MSKLTRLSLRLALACVCVLSLTAIDFNATIQAQSSGQPAASKQTTRKKKRRRARRITTRREIVTERSKSTATSNQSPRPTVVGSRDAAPSGPSPVTGNVSDGTTASSQSKPVSKAPISGGVLNGKAISLPQPVYPMIARAVRVSGMVVVLVTIDEEGNVISASVVSGHPLLQAAALDAARRAKFPPTKLSGQPVKVTGTITYNFVWTKEKSEKPGPIA
jgi:TonB family protein